MASVDECRQALHEVAASDDLVALVQGKLDVTRAIASRQVSIKANPFDLLKLRKLL